MRWSARTVSHGEMRPNGFRPTRGIPGILARVLEIEDVNHFDKEELPVTRPEFEAALLGATVRHGAQRLLGRRFSVSHLTNRRAF